MSASSWRRDVAVVGLALLAGFGASRGASVMAEGARHPFQAAAPTPAQAPPQPAAAPSGGAEEVVRALYRYVSFARGRDVRWDDVRALFIPEAVIVLRSSRTSMTVYNPDGFVREFVTFVSNSKLEDRAFEESILAIKAQEIGDVARAIVHYAARIPSEPRRPEQGIDVFLLMKKEGAWRIVSLVNELVRPGVPVPEELGAVPPAAARDIIASVAPGGSGPPAADSGFGVMFYSGRGGNDDIYLLHPGQREPLNLTRHPARDHCPAASPDGKRIAFLSDRGGNFDIYSMATDGSDVRQLTTSPEKEEHPEFSPDGRTVVFVRDFEQRTEVWVMNADGSGQRRLTSGGWRDERPFVSPDGSRILFMSNRDGNYEIYTMDADGSGQTRLTRTPEHEIFPAWSPDGRQIVYSRKFRADGRMEGMIRVMNADGTLDHEITGVATRDENGLWSPDGRLVIFQSVRDGNFEVYQVHADGSHPVRLTNHPAWDGWASFVRLPKDQS